MPEVAVNQDNVVYTVKQMSPYIAFVVAAFVALVVGYASYFHTEEEPLWVSGYGCLRSLLLHEPVFRGAGQFSGHPCPCGISFLLLCTIDTPC